MLRVWLLDASEDLGSKVPSVLIWVIKEDGSRTALRANYYPSIYLVGEDEEKKVKDLIRIFADKILDAELKSVKIRGKEVKAIKVRLNSTDVESLGEKISKELKLKVYNYDIRYTTKFWIENKIEPSTWYEFAEKNTEGIIEVDISTAKKLDKNKPKLKVISFEVIYFSERGTPRADRDPVVAIALCSDEGYRKVITGKENEILSTFCDEIMKIDPDVIVGFKNNQVHWSYLLKRAKINSVKLKVGRNRSEPHQSVFGHFSIQGRINIDLFDLVKETPEVKLESLEEYAEFLNIKVNYSMIDEFELSERWKSKTEEVKNFCLNRAATILEIYNSLEDYIFELSKITSLPADQVLATSPGFRVENYLMKKAEEVGELVPERKEIVHESYQGAIVRAPISGLHENVAVVDFKSMYPSLMIKYNISFDTIVRNGERAPGLNFGFSKERGFLPMALVDLIEERDRIRKSMREVKEGSTEHKVLDSRQRAIKIITNAVYGYTGWAGARWYAREVAEATTAWGRLTITSAIDKAEKLGLSVIYSDTDSLFVSYEKDKVEEFLEWIKNELGLEAKIDKIFLRIIFTEAKKKYAGLTEDGKVEFVGLEAVRGDWSAIAKEVQSKVIESILKTGSKDEGLRVLNEYIDLLRKASVDIKKLVIWKQITRPIEEYEATAPHIVVAKYLIKSGWKVDPGDKVGYVVIKGSGRIYTRVKPYFEAKPEEIDWQYYIENQVVAACERILEAVGIDVEKVGKYKQSKLFT
ncbi:MAG: DNA-directed DNA polymerase [Thermoproteota archaeon]